MQQFQHPHMHQMHQGAPMSGRPQGVSNDGGRQQQQSLSSGQQQQSISLMQQQQQHLHQQQQQSQQKKLSNGNFSLTNALQKLASANEKVWLHIGGMSESFGDLDRAMNAYESALRNNPYSVPALTQIAAVYRTRDQFVKAVEYFQRILNIESNNGEIWGALGHCYLMMDDLPKAYNSYQQALVYLPNPKEPKLWYGIGILYDRYGSFEHAEEAFTSVIKMDPKFEKSNEIYFRLGIIYKQQSKYDLALQCFRFIMKNPPTPLTEVDILFQIGHVQEFKGEFANAKEAYELVLKDNPNHAKVLQQLGWLYHQPSSFNSQESAVQFLSKSLESDGNDPQTWYLLGRCYMAQQMHSKAYEAYQQAVYRGGRNPIYWCSIGVLYFIIGQFRDALDAYTRAIKINAYIPEVWFNLGILYESCNNQVQDAIDAYSRALELDQKNTVTATRVQYLKAMQSNGGKPSGQAIPPPSVNDINPNSYKHGFPGQQIPPPFGRTATGGSTAGGPAAPPTSSFQQGSGLPQPKAQAQGPTNFSNHQLSNHSTGSVPPNPAAPIPGLGGNLQSSTSASNLPALQTQATPGSLPPLATMPGPSSAGSSKKASPSDGPQRISPGGPPAVSLIKSPSHETAEMTTGDIQQRPGSISRMPDGMVSSTSHASSRDDKRGPDSDTALSPQEAKKAKLVTSPQSDHEQPGATTTDSEERVDSEEEETADDEYNPNDD